MQLYILVQHNHLIVMQILRFEIQQHEVKHGKKQIHEKLVITHVLIDMLEMIVLYYQVVHMLKHDHGLLQYDEQIDVLDLEINGM